MHVGEIFVISFLSAITIAAWAFLFWIRSKKGQAWLHDPSKHLH
jgi:hypothetical protein